MTDTGHQPAKRPPSSHPIQIGAGTFLITSDDDYVNDIGSNFEPHMCRLFRSLIKPHHHVLDIGANIGCTTLLFAQLAKEVDSFEPSPSTFYYLDLNVKNSHLRNIQLHNVGLGAKDESLTLTFSPSNRSGGFVSNITQASVGHSVENIEIRRGDEFVTGKSIDFIKIDVEGFEKHVIEGLRRIIDHNHPIVVLELNHWCLNAFQRMSIPEFFDFLLERFPILYAIHDNEYMDLHDVSNRYAVMYQHIIHFKYSNLVGAFDKEQVTGLIANDLRTPITP